MTPLWGALAAAALLWPGRLHGFSDGIPLDRVGEAVVVGALFPLLCLVDPEFLRTRVARMVIVALLAWHVGTASLLAQDGWCARFVPSRPYAKDAVGAPHAWDLRADWRAADPACSAIVTRPYTDLHEFPAWFFNLPPANDSWPGPLDRPPGASVAMSVRGFLRAAASGRLRIEQDPATPTEIFVDGQRAAAESDVAAGVHTVAIRTQLTGDNWRFVPTWNGRDLWSTSIATVTKPSRADIFARRWMAWMPTFLVGVLIVGWVASALGRVGDVAVLTWTAVAAGALAALVAFDHADVARRAVPLLALAALVPVPPRLRTWRGALLMIGVPWMTFAVACATPAIGRWVLYETGNDYWMFQRYAYRIVMQGYWLEGGSPTFWFQPFYRWIAGALHVVFGDSSAGEWYWDGACLAAGALFAFAVVDRMAGFRWALVAAVVPLATFTCGTAQYLIGRGLGEISSAGFVYAAALFALRARNSSWAAALGAGVLATLAFYTRLNNLLMAAGVIVFAMPLRRRPLAAWREPLIIAATLATGVLLFAWRTWHYTGVFSVFYGTQWKLLGMWQPGTAVPTLLERMASSLAMVLTVNDPPRFDVYAVPVVAGAACAALAACRAWRFRAVPLQLVAFFGASIVGALVARGSAYPGRFSVHVIPVASAIAVCAMVALFDPYRPPSRPRAQ